MGCVIQEIQYYLPKGTLTNADCANTYYNFDEKKIEKKTGIRSRCIAAEDECASDMAVSACEKLFATGCCELEDIDFLILCTQSSDYKLPTTACLVQQRLHLRKNIGAFDINLGCSGFVYALSIAKGLIEGKLAKNVLLIMSETYSKFIHPKDRSVRTIFGDGAAAILVSESKDDNMKDFIFGTDGEGATELIVPAGGSRMPYSKETCIEYEDKSGIRTKENLYMNGSNVFMFSVEIIAKMYQDLLEKYDCSIDDIDLIIPHQANKFILDYAREELGVDEDKMYINMKEIGNTVSASIPIAMKMAESEGRLQRGDRVMLLGFGVGYSWAGTILTY